MPEGPQLFCDATAQKITILIVVIIMFFFTTSFLPALSGSGRRRRAGSHGEPLDARASSFATDTDASIGRQSGTPSSVSHVVDAASKPPPPPIAAKPRVKSTGEKPTWIQKTSLSTRAAASTRIILLLEYSLLYISGCKFPFPVAVVAVT